MARPNYEHVKRMKDLAKKKKREEKKQRKLDKKNLQSEESPDQSCDEQEK